MIKLMMHFLLLLLLLVGPTSTLIAQQTLTQFPEVIQVSEDPDGELSSNKAVRNVTSPIVNAPEAGNNNIIIPINQQAISKRPNIITQAAAITLMSLLPYLVILLTSFLKIIVVLSLLRNAIGVQQSPPNQVLNGLALILSVYVMFPTGLAMYNEGKDLIDNKAPSELVSAETTGFILEFVDRTKAPLKKFLENNTSAQHLQSFYKIAYKVLPESTKASLTQTDFLILIPSYITSQLKDAYQIGVLIYLPFFVIDLVVSNILLAMGMMMLSPLTIALPLKLLLLVMLDGWTLLIQGLVLSFK
ncbi:MAG: type III secretion system export apparatus subunit SctR [Chlamydiales bacterium]|nr:type III secretion system export apparatus subunit SctR [Chlamydiales bacterium]